MSAGRRSMAAALSALAACGLEAGAQADSRTAAPPGRFSFSGYEWTVKSSERPTAPQDNLFGKLGDTVRVDENGDLVLSIEKGSDGNWRSAEIILTKSLGYGTYRFRTKTRLDQLDASAVAGFFTWDPRAGGAHRELDIEFSRWGDPRAATNAQFVVQPFDEDGNMRRFRIEQEGDNTSHELRWEKGRASFASWHGHGPRPERESPLLICEWSRQGAPVPEPGAERLRVNLYLYRSKQPISGTRAELRLSAFEFESPRSGN